MVPIVALAIIVRQHMETVGDRKAVAAHLRGLRDTVRNDDGDGKALDEIISTLNGDWSFARSYACGVLGELGPRARRAVPDLIRALDSGDKVVEGAAAIALGDVAIGMQEPVPALVRKLSSDWDSSSFSAESLGKIGKPALSAIPALEKAAHAPPRSSIDTLPSVARRALEKLKRLDGAVPHSSS
jgi:HEAT repeat protein